MDSFRVMFRVRVGIRAQLNGLTVVARGVTMSRRASNNASRND